MDRVKYRAVFRFQLSLLPPNSNSLALDFISQVKAYKPLASGVNRAADLIIVSIDGILSDIDEV